MPCDRGVRDSMNLEKARKLAAQANPEPKFSEVIQRCADLYAALPDEEILRAIRSSPELADESSPKWEDDEYWNSTVASFLALADIVGERKLVGAIRLVLDRACFGDPGEIMGGLRHSFEQAVNPDWPLLADICIAASESSRLGTRLWALDQLAILEDVRAAPVFKRALLAGPEEIRQVAANGLRRLSSC